MMDMFLPSGSQIILCASYFCTKLISARILIIKVAVVVRDKLFARYSYI
jgi:hypothetical protein